MTNKLEQAARQALEALEGAKSGMDECREETGFDFANEQYDISEAITDLREALAKQAEQGMSDAS